MRITLKKYIVSFSNQVGLTGIVWLSAPWACFILFIGAWVNPLQIHTNTDSPTGFTQADLLPVLPTLNASERDTLHIHFISGSEEYKSEASLKGLKQKLEQDYHKIRVTASWGEDAGEELPDIHHLADADLMLVFARRMTLPDDQLAYILQHIKTEKPVVGLRTASHAFQDFLELDSEVFGGDYDGHGEQELVEVTIAGKAEGHPVLKNVQPWTRPGKIYHNPNLKSGTQVLLFGVGLDSNLYDPLAWTHIYGNQGRAFYTSMGLPSDFENENFLQLILNAISWTTERDLLPVQTYEEQTDEESKQQGFYREMDYGPIIAETIRMQWPENSLVRKGLAIRLNHKAAMIFDTDLMRFAAGTAGGWLDISETDYVSYKGSDIASVEGRQVFFTSEIAGWANEGSFYGPREDGMGNLPRDWAHYQGYYRYGDQVVLSYTVRGTEVLELPEAIEYGESLAFARTLKIGASDKSLTALLADMQDSWSVSRTTGRGVILDTGEAALAIRIADPATGVELEVGEENHIELHIPPSDTHQTIRVLIFEMSTSEDPLYNEFLKNLEPVESVDFERMKKGGPARWEKEIEVTGVVQENGSGYVLDRIPVPFDNPWGSWIRLSGLDFFEDGTRAAVSTWNGDVWIVSGIDKDLGNIRWRRFASGLFYPMGVAIVDGKIFVTERSQLTRLHDLNGNGEADYYENFNNDGIVYPMAHTLGLEVDSDGYFYFFKNGNRVPSEVPQHGSLVRVSPDGQMREVFARGFRGANTLGIGEGDRILAADQEGNWVPVDRIDVMKRGGFYGDRRHGGEDHLIGEFEVPVTWTPKVANNSSGMLAYVGDDRWGPLAGQWILGSYGQRKLFVVLTEEVGSGVQGGIVPLQLESTSGLMRGRVNPTDGQLYMVGLRGWQTLANEDAGFERVRYAGGHVNLPKELHVTPAGVEIEFTDPLDPASARNVRNYKVERWEYEYSEHYGSPEISLDNPGEEKRDAVDVSSAVFSEDRRKIFLEIPDMRSVMQMMIAYDLRFENGQTAENAIYHTVNWLSEADTEERPEWQQRIIAGRKESTEVTKPEDTLSLADVSEPEWYQQGATSFQRHCAACHVKGGVAPPMEESEWAASGEVLVRILLNGKQGTRGVMTPFAWMNDDEIASIASYIRLRWHEGDPITASEVEEIRRYTAERTELWTEEELRTLLN